MSETSGGHPGVAAGGPSNNNNNIAGSQRSNHRSRGTTKPAAFKGETEELLGYYYDVAGPRSGESFAKVTERIGRHVVTQLSVHGAYQNGLSELSLPTLVEPTKPEKDKDGYYDELERDIYKAEYDEWRKAKKKRQDDESKVYAVILGQCTQAMKDRLHAESSWPDVKNQMNTIELLKLIRVHSHTQVSDREPSHALYEAIRDLVLLKQGDFTLDKYQEEFESRVAKLELAGGEIGKADEYVDACIRLEKGASHQPTNAERRLAADACRDKLLGTMFLMNSHKSHKELKDATENQFVFRREGENPYPTSIADARNKMGRYRTTRSGTRQDNYEVTFLNDADEDNSRAGTGQGGRGGRGGRGGGRGGRGSGSGGRGNSGRGQPNDSTGNSEGTPNASTGNQGSNTSNSVNDNNSTTNAYSPLVATSSTHIGTKRIPESWIIIDTGSSVDIFLPDMLTDIHQVDDPLHVVSTGGTTVIKEKGTLPGYPTPVWCHRGGVANIFSFHNVQNHFRVTYDNETEDAFTVHDGDVSMKFKPASNKIYYHDVGENPDNLFLFLQTVEEKKLHYTKRAVREAQDARRAQDIMMRPPLRRLMDLVTQNAIQNCPIERRHLQVAEDIFGPNLGALKGKTRHRRTTHVTGSRDDVPTEILKAHRNVTLATDLFFINKVPFLLTISRDLRIGHVADLPSRHTPVVRGELKKLVKQYRSRGFRVRTILADNEFESVTDHPIRGVDFDLCGADEHVPDIERFVQTVKNSVRSQYNMLPFRSIPRAMLTHLVKNAVFWLNAFPHPDGVSQLHSPMYLFEGRKINYRAHVRIPFGAYAQVHEKHDNSMQPRTVGAICLGPSGNEQGGHYFLSLWSGKRLHRPHFTEMPMPADVIDRVTAMGEAQGMPPTLTFADRYGTEILEGPNDVDDDHDPDYDYEPDSDDDSDADFSVASGDASVLNAAADASIDLSAPHPADGAATGVTTTPPEAPNVPINVPITEAGTPISRLTTPTTNSDADTRAQPPPNTDTDEESPAHQHDSEGTQYYDPRDDEWTEDSPSAIGQNLDDDFADVQHESDDGLPYVPGQTTGVGEHGESTGVGSETVENTGVSGEESTDPDEIPENTGVEGGMTLRPRRTTTKPTHLVGKGFEDAFQFLMPVQLMTEQMTAKKGIKKFGKAGLDAITAEMQQIHYRRVLKPRMKKDLTRDQLRDSLRYLMFLKQKRCGKIKGRGCADGRKQRLWKTKEETSSPTVRTESVFLSAAIDAHENRRVTTVDIPGAFMQADIDEFVLVKFEGETAEGLERVDPSLYKKFTVVENGKKVIYAELQKALYGTLQAAMLFWKELTAFLVDELEFVVNPYDKCVANKDVDGSQMTILWHVDDIKISHKNQSAIDAVVARLNDRWGKETPLTVTNGAKHDYLGMTFDYLPGHVKVTMFDFIDSMLDDLPEDFDGTAVTPAANYLFTTYDGKSPKLDSKAADMFHHNVAKLLYLSKRARPDIQTAVSYLTTRVVSPNVADMKKLKRVMQYLRATRDLPLILSGNPKKIAWWIDASFAVHEHDMRSHTGALMSLGRGAVYAMSTKQKINTKSSTEAELVGVDDGMFMVVWTRNFLEAQGYPIEDNVVYQDNQSAILLERNGQQSSGRRTRHINIRYFFVKDRIDNKELRVEYCPTKKMRADPLTKPLQGSLFRVMRDFMLGHIPMDQVHPAESPNQECVGTSINEETDGQTGTSGAISIDDDVASENTSGWTLVCSANCRKSKIVKQQAHNSLRI